MMNSMQLHQRQVASRCYSSGDPAHQEAEDSRPAAALSDDEETGNENMILQGVPLVFREDKAGLKKLCPSGSLLPAHADATPAPAPDQCTSTGWFNI